MMGLRWKLCTDAWRLEEFLCASVCGEEFYGEAEVCLFGVFLCASCDHLCALMYQGIYLFACYVSIAF